MFSLVYYVTQHSMHADGRERQLRVLEQRPKLQVLEQWAKLRVMHSSTKPITYHRRLCFILQFASPPWWSVSSGPTDDVVISPLTKNRLVIGRYVALFSL